MPWQTRWYATKDEALAFVQSIARCAWGIELRKVNKANKTYAFGYTVQWYWKKGVSC